ncbi:phenylacetate--CoA ligase family protein, partial [Vibrio anguillarum]|nr:phenylacetate--CoA ligase family protein [Vibrio anguillarum]
IGKEDIRIAPCAFLNDSKKFSYTFKSQTGGTTGKPLNLYSGLSAIIEDHAQSHRQLTWAGYLPGDKRVWLRADLIVPLEQNTSPYWRHNRIDKMLMMSVYHLSEETVRQY